ncbi:M3 family oligoendopeptidase [Jeotgalibaca arthritidis]|uniref:M3 family oligoendopeptidase n=2 Tax=Jeotgalibaca TaxID=1470540 RepID=A0A6G7KCL5_9LACT|nr:M3 family oligoendopeptidase [Jeotgalibaca arthritidis]QII83018.1 M3 family oligoendopeptidase [Jeotgalibaca arthritidis]
MKYPLTWDLDSIFPGGSHSKELQDKLVVIEEDVKAYFNLNESWEPASDKPHYQTFQTLIAQSEIITKAISQTASFINAVQSADVTNTHAPIVRNQIAQLSSQYAIVQTSVIKKLAAISDEDFGALIKLEAFENLAFALTETREKGNRLLSEAEESMLSKLSQDGFHAWSNHYDTLVSYIKIPFEAADGRIQELSAGQAMNRMYSDSDPAVRQQLFVKWEEAWASYAPLFAETLNHLQGFRLEDYKLHGSTDFMEEPLRYNRIEKETLDAMWQAITNHKQPYLDFLNRKAALMGKEKLAWYDVDAPVSVGDFNARTFTYDEAVDFIVENFAKFGPTLAQFAQDLVGNGWVEAEDRAGKRPGGYCTSIPESKESRIFMTFTGSASDMSTLAHEIGHAFHSYTMWDLPTMNTRYAMNVAETASTFAETIVSSATVDAAESDEEKISLLNTKLENATAMFLNIHARFLFEQAFYTERQKGLVSAERLSELMVDAQKEAFQNQLSEYHPHFWASKLHFFIDNVPFYNFPYTFGFLFSLSIFAEYQKNPAGFEEKYMALLKDTAVMKTEDLVMKHLGKDIRSLAFWEQGLAIMEKDVHTFLALTEDKI